MMLGREPALPVGHDLAENCKEFQNSNLELNYLGDIFLRAEEENIF